MEGDKKHAAGYTQRGEKREDQGASAKLTAQRYGVVLDEIQKLGSKREQMSVGVLLFGQLYR